MLDYLKTAKTLLELDMNSTNKRRMVIDAYNRLVPKVYGKLPRGYQMNYNDAWCAATVSMCLASNGYKNFPYECSVQRMKDGFPEQYILKPPFNLSNDYDGFLICYDWQGNSGWLDHIGFITAVDDVFFITIEGNYGNQVKSRVISSFSSSIACIIDLPAFLSLE